MDIYRLLDYDRWATTSLLEAVESLSPEQFVQEFAGSLSSVRQQLVHLLSVTDRYRARLAQEAVPEVATESFATPYDLITYEAQVRFRASVEETLVHMVNHATYHRGQIACLLKLHNIDFADTDFIIWINRSQYHND
jgi:uncharacterized damage-inducible protein DinB